jgi:phenylacetic acid degradation protein paaN
MSPLFDTHKKTLEGALAAIRKRDYWSAYPEIPSGKIYGESGKDDGLAAFKGYCGKTFALDQPAGNGTVGDERSPYGPDLNIKYPKPVIDTLLAAARAAQPKWRDAGVEARAGVCLEILHRLNRRSFELANAVMHTTGQGFMMAFQAGGPHAQDRGLEALAYAYDEMTRTPATARWTKQIAKDASVTLQKRYRIVPRGVALLIGCSTFPTWNGYPGLFASLATGNAVVVKPHPGAILPLAITVKIAREVLQEQGFDPNVVTLAADSAAEPITKELVRRPEIGIIDYTGSSSFGEWIEQNAAHAALFTEKAGVNSVIIDGTDDLKGMANNLAFSLCLYSGQMCTTPQNIFIPKDGVTVGGERKSFDEVAQAIVGAVDGLLGEPRRAAEVLGAIQNEATLQRVDDCRRGANAVLRESTPVANEMFPQARVRSPLILKIDAEQTAVYGNERFGPIAFIVRTDDTKQSIEKAAETARIVGAITCSVYSTDPKVLQAAEDATAEAGVPLSCNLTGPIYVNQAAAFSDFHVSGANPSGNATLCDAAYVANRFRIVQSRVPIVG